MSPIEQYMDQENLHHNEGERGVRNLEQLVKALGYRENGFRYGTAIEVFLQDNPGAIEAVQNWIIAQEVVEWEQKAEELLEEEEDDDEEEDEDIDDGVDEEQEWADFDPDC